MISSFFRVQLQRLSSNGQPTALPSRHASQGFTIVELLIVIVVIAILAAVTIVSYNGVQQRARTATVLSDLNGAAKTLSLANITNSAYPVDLTTAKLKASNGTAYQYTYTAADNSYCLTAINSTIAYMSSSSNPTPTAGLCSGHTATVASSLSCAAGYIVVPGSSLYGTNDFCVMKYEAKNNGSNSAVSTAASTPWVNISQTSAITTATAACSGCHLITESEWLTIAQNVLSVASNWSGGAVGLGYIYSGHWDNAPANALVADTNDANGYSGETNTGGTQRRTLTLTNGNVIWDLAGNVMEWTSGTSQGNEPGKPGLQWWEWNEITVQGNLSPSASPTYANSAAASWNSTQGIGRIAADTNSTTLHGFLRGGLWNGANVSGIFSLYLVVGPNTISDTYGFRVAQ